jgi:O-antigen ligase
MTDFSARSRGLQVAEVVSVLVAFVGAALVARFDAGLSGAWVLIGVASAIPLYVVARGWRLPWWLHLGAAWLPAAVVIASAIHGYGDGASRASRYAYGAVILLAIIAWARDPARRLVAASGVILLTADTYLTAWWPWWGSNDAIKSMFGNYYTQNVFAMALVIGAAVAIGIVVAGSRLFVFAGFIVTCLAGAGVLASGSRAGLILLGVALLAGLALGIIARGWRGAVRAAVLAIAIPATAWFMTSPIFFSNSGSFFGITRRIEDAGASIAGRISFWNDAIRLGAEAPLTGHGLKSFGPLVQCLGSARYSSNAHNETLLAWAETGIIGVIPFLALIGGVVLVVVRSLRPAPVTERRLRWVPSRAEVLDDPARWGALVALVLALVHLHFDFDWAYPAIIGLTGFVAGIAAAPVVPSRSATRLRATLAVALGVVLVATAVAGFAIDPYPGDPLLPISLERAGCRP